MKQLNEYITEKFKLNSKNIKKQYNYHPKTKDELKELINRLIKERGNDANLNDIDTSEITNMCYLFAFDKDEFNGDISQWDVSNVTNMEHMFQGTKFNGDISMWDVSKVKYMAYMFEHSKFNRNISKWDVSNVTDMEHMFDRSKFSGDISNWDVSNTINMNGMFNECPLEKNTPKWYKEWWM